MARIRLHRLGNARPAEIEPVAGRRVDRADDGHARADERDVDGEVVAAADELAGAVERIDEKEHLPASRGARPADASSSATIGTPGNRCRNPESRIASASRSALVTGEASAFSSAAMPAAAISMIRAPALSTSGSMKERTAASSGEAVMFRR